MKTHFPFVSLDFSGPQVLVQGDESQEFGYHLRDQEGFDDGIYAKWHWDGDVIHAEVDWLGVQPLFYAREGSRIIISNSILRIIEQGGSPELDYGAVGVFFRLGFLLGCDTVFAHIKAFPPGGRLAFDGHTLTVTEDYPKVDPCAINQADEEEAYIELFRQSISRRGQECNSFIQPISGGRDSRHIIAELMRQNICPEYAYTIQTNYKDTALGEERIAAELAKRLKVEHRIIKHPLKSEVRREAMKNMLTNFACDEGSWMLGALGVLGDHPNAIYDGILGDVLSAHHWVNSGGDLLEAYETGGSEGAVDAIIKRFSVSDDVSESFFMSHFLGEPDVSRECFRARVLEFFNKFTDKHNPITQFFLFSRGRREIAMSTWGGYPFVNKIHAPFLDRDFFHYFLSTRERIEPTYAYSRSRAIARAYPELRDLPYAKTQPASRTRALFRRANVLRDVVFCDSSDVVSSSKSLRAWGVQKALGHRSGAIDMSRLIYFEQIQHMSQQRAAELLSVLNQAIHPVSF